VKFHLFGLAHIPVKWDRCVCGFTTLTYNMARMLKAAGHEVILYGAAGSDAPCDEFVEAVSREMLAASGYDESRPGAVKWSWRSEDHDQIWAEFQRRTVPEFALRFQKGDIALIGFGTRHQFVSKVAPLTVEFAVGYRGAFARYKVFPSVAWQHFIYGVWKRSHDAAWYDTVIPHYLDPEQFPVGQRRGDYLLFMGRLEGCKGPEVAIDIAKAAGLRLLVAGESQKHESAPKWLVERAKGANVEFLGPVHHAQRVDLLGNALATVIPSRMIDPCCQVAIESQACGTPVICTDWGGYTDTVEEGVTGYRCQFFSQFLKAIDRVCDGKIAPASCRQRVEALYSLDAVWPRYQTYFDHISAVEEHGWYAQEREAVSASATP